MTTEDVATDLAWISCNRPCNWWVHTRCVGIHYENTKKGEKKLDDWAKHHYYCQKHIPKAQAVGWDKIQQKEVVEKQPNKRETLKKIITEKKKFCEKQQKVILPL